MRHWILITALVSSLATPAAADVLRVGGPTPDFPSLAAAVNAAADGDTILVRTGGLGAPVTIDGKSLTIVSDEANDWLAKLFQPIQIRNLAPGQVVVLEKLEIDLPTSSVSPSPALLVRFCQGSVRVDRCVLEGYGPDVCDPQVDGQDGVLVQQSDDVSFSNCVILGGQGKIACDDWPCGNGLEYYVGIGGAGVFVRDSAVAFFDCSIIGGYGGYAWDDVDGADGGPALEVRDGFAFLSGCTVTGGGGGFGADDWIGGYPGCGGNGEVAALLATATSRIEYLGTSFAGGQGGTAGCFPCNTCDGSDAPPFQIAPGATTLDLALPARSMTVSAAVRELTPTAFHFEGQPGDDVYLFLSPKAAFVYPAPIATGPQLFGTPIIRRFFVGTIPASGELDVAINAPALAPGVENLTWYWQALFAAQQNVFAASEAWILVDSAF